MNATAKPVLMLVSTLLLGIVIGAAGMVAYRGPLPALRPPPPEGRPGGFVAHMEETIQPRDASQRAAIRSILEATDRQNRMTVDASRQAMRDGLDSMRSKLAPLLDASQNARLDGLVRSLHEPPPGRRGPPPRP